MVLDAEEANICLLMDSFPFLDLGVELLIIVEGVEVIGDKRVFANRDVELGENTTLELFPLSVIELNNRGFSTEEFEGEAVKKLDP